MMHETKSIMMTTVIKGEDKTIYALDILKYSKSRNTTVEAVIWSVKIVLNIFHVSMTSVFSSQQKKKREIEIKIMIAEYRYKEEVGDLNV